MKELLVAFLFALVLGSVINGCMQPNTTISSTPSTTVNPGQSSIAPAGTGTSMAIAAASDASFNKDVLTSSKPVLVDFWATWCGPCRHMEPVLEQVSQEYSDKLKVVKVDVDANPKLVNTYQVNAMPTFMLFKHGKRVDAIVGAVPKQDLETAIKKYID